MSTGNERNTKINKDEVLAAIQDDWTGVLSHLGITSIKQQSDGTYMCKCPFHVEKTGSFHVFDIEGGGGWHCFACKAEGGDVFSLKMALHKCQFPQALLELADYCGITSSRKVKNKKSKKEKHVTPGTGREKKIDYDELKRLYEKRVNLLNLERHQFVKEWLLKEWGVTEEWIKKLGLGYQPQYKQYPARVCIPVFNEDGDLVNLRKYGGKDAASRGCGKITNQDGYGSPSQLVGAHLLKVKPDLPVMVCAGEKDWCVAMVHLDGIVLPVTNTGGEGKGKWKKRFSELIKNRDVIICYDVDETGRSGSREVAKSVFRQAKSVKEVEWPDEFSRELPKGDLTDFIMLYEKGGVKEFFEVLKSARKLSESDFIEVPGSSQEVQDGERPMLFAGETDLNIISMRAWEAIKKWNVPYKLFKNGGQIAEIRRDDMGAYEIHHPRTDSFMLTLAEIAQWYKIDRKGNTYVSYPSKQVARTMMASNVDCLPILNRVVASPVFASDGSLITSPGYNEKARVFYAPQKNFKVPEVPEKPTDNQVDEAVRYITDEVFVDFPFLGPADRANNMALFLAPFMRDMIDGPTPLHLVEKPMAGTGASLLIDCIAIASTGTNADFLTEGKDEEEWRKRVTSTLRPNPQIVSIDNLRRRLDSSALAAAITASTWQDRVLGSSINLKMPVKCIWIASGNNPTVSSEIARRVVTIRMDAKTDKPHEPRSKPFRHKNLRKFCRKNRGQIVWSALTVIRAWVRKGMPKGDITLGNFEPWAEIMGGVLDVAGIPAFLDNIHEFYERADEEGEQWRVFISEWWEKYQSTPVGVKQLFEIAASDDVVLDMGRGSERSQKTKFGKMIKKCRDRHFGEFRVEHFGFNARASQWRLVKKNDPNFSQCGFESEDEEKPFFT